MNIIILINPSVYPGHLSLTSMLQAYLGAEEHTVSILDIDSEKYEHLIVSKIKEIAPDILITLDLAGFRFRTQSGECALNLLFTKNLNLIWGDKSEYELWLSGKISLSMMFYDASGQDADLCRKYPNLLYYHSGEKYKIAASSDQDQETARSSFHRIWQNFIAEITFSDLPF